MSTLLEPGKTFAGRYRIERFLAEGGFGAVYVAEQLATEAKVAVKVLWPHVLQSEDAVEKFQQEARIAGRVRSEHIVRVLDAGFDEESRMPFLTMELLDGEDLQRLVEHSGPVPGELVIAYLSQVASALDKAHRAVDRDGVLRPIVHRDLKPENLFLTRRDDGSPLVKVLDFGIAKVLSSTSNMSREVKGTPLYMAYEQASGAPITPQTDVWAFGLIAFFLLAGRAYWRTANREDGALTQLFGEVMQLPIDPPSERARELGMAAPWPPGFDDWFLHCVHRDPALRFQTAGAAAESLASLGWPRTEPGFGVTPAPMGWRVPQQTPPYSDSAPSVGHAATGQRIALAGTIRSRPPPKRSGVGWLVAAIGVALVVGVALVATIAIRHPTPTAVVSSEATIEPPAASSITVAPAAPAVESEEPSASAPPVESAPPQPRAKAEPRVAPRSHPDSGAGAPAKPPGSSNVVYTER
jgi:eukaryotic-like serine/threonine-protein kinase